METILVKLQAIGFQLHYYNRDPIQGMFCDFGDLLEKVI